MVNMSEFQQELTLEMETELKNLNMDPHELRQLAIKSGVEEAALNLGRSYEVSLFNVDESESETDESQNSGDGSDAEKDETVGGDNKDVPEESEEEEEEEEGDDDLTNWKDALVGLEDSNNSSVKSGIKEPGSLQKTTSGTLPQMTSKQMEEKMRKQMHVMVKRAYPRDAEKIVTKWASSTGMKLGRKAKNMLIGAMTEHTDLDEVALPWILLGWNRRGEDNVNDARDVHLYMKDLTNRYIAADQGMKKSTDNLITGFKECQREMQTLVQDVNKCTTCSSRGLIDLNSEKKKKKGSVTSSSSGYVP